jgi:arsenite methyltransferase
MSAPVYSFSGDLARLQQATAKSHDNIIRRSKVLSALNLRTGKQVLEVGCGGGYYTSQVAGFVGPSGRVCAIDISRDQIAAAQQRCAEFAWVECSNVDIASAPYGDGEFDAALAVQVLEYVADLDAGLSHIHRVLRPGGRLVVVATDWGSAVWHSENPSRMRRILTAWEPHKPWLNLPSILAPRLRRAGLQPLRQVPLPILNTSFNSASASYWVARSIRSTVVGRQKVTEEAAEWFDEFPKLEGSGAYFFSVTPVLTEAVKVA